MGLSDVIPGVSGGTIALITGIYERLISAINSVDLKIPFYIFPERDFNKVKSGIKSIDLEFLAPLVLGIGTAFLVASRFILRALNNYPTFTYAFFFGLILASAIKIYGRITESLAYYSVGIGILGLVFAFYITGLDSIRLVHSPFMVFFSGFIAICAMILPGVSGSFILLTLGQYEYMLAAINDIASRYLDLMIFMVGALISLFTFSKLLSKLFESYEQYTLSFLTGLMLGALRLPLVQIIRVEQKYPRLDFVWSNTNVLMTFLFGGLGVLVVFILESERFKS